jgi:hypothetical protein
MRRVIDLLWLKKLLNAKISREIHLASGAEVIGLWAIQKSKERFEESEQSFEDEGRSRGHRSTDHLNTIRALLADDPHLSQKRIACIVSIHQNTIKYVLRKNLSLESQFQVNASYIGWRSRVGQRSALNIDPGTPRVKMGMCACKCTFEERNVDSSQESAIFSVGGRRKCTANWHWIVSRREKGDDLGWFLVF